MAADFPPMNLHTFGFSIAPAPAAPPPAVAKSRSPRRRTSAGSWSVNYGSVYDAATRADFSGYLYVPSLELSASLRAMPLRVLRERSLLLYANTPAARMVYTSLAKQEAAGGLWPSWVTESTEFNDAMTDLWHWQNHDARFFSADGHDTAYSFQVTVGICIRLWGDCFVQLLRPAEGSTRPSVNIIPGYRVDNFGVETPGDGWTDGVLLSPLGRALAYRVITVATDGTRSFQDVPADDMIHCHDGLLPGQVRGEPALACAARKLFRREDILEAVANGTLSREQLGYAIERQLGASAEMPLPSNGGEVVEEENDDDENDPTTVAKVFGANRKGDVAIPVLPAGQTLKTVESDRPGTNVREFCDEILREIAWAVGYPPDYIFFISGMSQGTAVRTVLRQVQAALDSVREYRLKPLLHRYSVFDCWQRIKAGVFGSKVPADWWRFEIVLPAPIDVDPGYVGALLNERAENGLMAIDTFSGLMGTTTRDIDEANLRVYGRRQQMVEEFNKKYGTSHDYAFFWPRSSNQLPPAATDSTPATNQ